MARKRDSTEVWFRFWIEAELILFRNRANLLKALEEVADAGVAIAEQESWRPFLRATNVAELADSFFDWLGRAAAELPRSESIVAVGLRFLPGDEEIAPKVSLVFGSDTDPFESVEEWTSVGDDLDWDATGLLAFSGGEPGYNRLAECFLRHCLSAFCQRKGDQLLGRSACRLVVFGAYTGQVVGVLRPGHWVPKNPFEETSDLMGRSEG